ncbi:hypothetical protein AB0N31_22885 [Streptomyces sp. NPDC051051]|uniref:hypothetical protein n=1 Tax=Streptomyces sp. NPDC051051 TaxID=3155666 RepID=UPI00344458AA
MTESIQTGTGTTREKAKAETSATAGQAKQAASQVAGTAAEQVQNVVGEARQQAGTVIDELRHRAMDEAEGQAKRAADTLRQWAGDLSGLAENAQGDSPARSLAAQVADKGHRAADYLDEQGVDGLVSNLQGFARRRPGVFLGGALLAGLAVGRLGRAAGSARSGGNGSQPPAGTPDQGALSTPVSPALPTGPLTGATHGAPGHVPPAPPAPPVTGTRPDGITDRPYPEV